MAGWKTSWTCEPFILQEMNNMENVSIFTWRACMAEMAIYFNGGLRETEQMVYGCANQGVIYSWSLDSKQLMTYSLCGCCCTHIMSCGKIVPRCFWQCLQSKNLQFHSQVYRSFLRNSGSIYLVHYLFRQPINTSKYSLSEECIQLRVSVEWLVFFFFFYSIQLLNV